MDALPFIVLVLGVITLVLGVITVLGHGIWLVLAAVFGGGRKPRRKCVYCGRLTPPSGSHCEWCGKDLTTPLSAELADIEAVFRQLRRLSAKDRL